MRNRWDAPIIPEVIIKFLQIVLIISLLLPIHVKAQEKIEVNYTDTLSEDNSLRVRDYSVVEKLEEEYKVAQAKLQIKKTYHGSYCSCVLYLKTYYGITYSIGNAHNWPVNAEIGSVGGVIVFNGKIGHVVRIIGLDMNGYIVDEANYTSCQHTSGRIVRYNDPMIKGFWNP